MRIKKLTVRWLLKHDACICGVEWFKEQKETDPIKVIKKLMKEDHFDWANWLIVVLMNYKQNVSYAVFAAEQVIDIYEKQYPNDDGPRAAIEAAKKCINNPSQKNKDAAYAATYTYAVYDNTATYTRTATYTTYAAAQAAYAAADTASIVIQAAYAADAKFKKEIINYGIKLLKENKHDRK